MIVIISQNTADRQLVQFDYVMVDVVDTLLCVLCICCKLCCCCEFVCEY